VIFLYSLTRGFSRDFFLNFIIIIFSKNIKIYHKKLMKVGLKKKLEKPKKNSNLSLFLSPISIQIQISLFDRLNG
jgi:hypothetical protein